MKWKDRIRKLERQEAHLKPHADKVLRKIAKAIRNGRVPKRNKADNRCLSDYREVKDELDKLRGTTKKSGLSEGYALRKGEEGTETEPSALGNGPPSTRLGGIEGYYAGPAEKEYRLWGNEEDQHEPRKIHSTPIRSEDRRQDIGLPQVSRAVEALHACLPEKTHVECEALLKSAAAHLGYRTLPNGLRRLLNKAIDSENRAGRLRTDWEEVWRPKKRA